MADTTADVIVVGGGIVGCAAAYFLSNRGPSVILIEKDTVAAHASGFAFGVLLPRLYDDPADPSDEITKLSLDLHRQIADELSDDAPGLRREKAAVYLALDDATATQYREIYRSREMLLGDVRWLEHGELSHVEARLSPEVRGGLYLGESAEISPSEFTTAMWQSAERRGARLVTAEVESISEVASGVAVRAAGTDYSADSVIVAAGPWSGRLLQSTGAKVPVEPLKGQIVRLRAPGPPMQVSLWWGPDYAGSKPDGLVWCGTTEERVGFDENTTREARSGILASASAVLPFLSSAEVVTQTACLRPVTADGLPVVGAVSDMSRLILATGGGRNGIVLGPGLGMVAANVAIGVDDGADYEYLNPARFGA